MGWNLHDPFWGILADLQRDDDWTTADRTMSPRLTGPTLLAMIKTSPERCNLPPTTIAASTSTG